MMNNRFPFPFTEKLYPMQRCKVKVLYLFIAIILNLRNVECLLSFINICGIVKKTNEKRRESERERRKTKKIKKRRDYG